MSTRILMIAGFFMIAGVLYALSATAGAAGFKEGLWSMTMTTKMEGNSAEAAEAAKAMKEMENMPPEAKAMMQRMQGAIGVQMGIGAEGITTTITQCMTNTNPVPDTKTAKNCKQTHEMRGNTVTFHMVCKEKNSEMDSTGKMTFTGDSMKGQMKSHQVSRGKTMDTTVQMAGKYLGPCKK